MTGGSQFVAVMAHFLFLFLTQPHPIRGAGNEIVCISLDILCAEVGEFPKIFRNPNFPLIQQQIGNSLFLSFIVR